MKLRKVLAAALLGLLVFAGYAMAVPAENALSPQPDESVYVVLKLNNIGNFLRWVLSQENIDVFMPLILAHEDSNEIMGAIEMARAVIDKTPLESIALTAGATKTGMPFMQAAFTVNSSLASTVRKIASGSADAKDIAKLILGEGNPFAALAESMIKVEHDGDKYIIDNELVLKTEGDLLLLSISPEEINSSLEALKDSKARLFAKTPRKFDTEDFVFVHVDPQTANALDDSDEVDNLKLEKYFSKPLNVEFAFKRVPDKFFMSWGLNLKEAMKTEYIDKYFNPSALVAAKGGHINLDSAGGSKSPLIALGGVFNVSGLNETKETRALWAEVVKQVKRFKITEEELFNVLNGPISFIINDSINMQGIRIPALFFSAAGVNGAAGKIFEKLSQSAHFSKLQDNMLQVDSSLSPVPCIITNNNGALGISMAENSNLADKPQPAGALADVMNRDAISAMVIDFTGIQSWINDNKVFNVVIPMANVFGPKYKKIAEQVRDVLNAKFSVTSFAMWAESPEVIHSEFAIENINAQDGLFAQIVKIVREYMTPAKTDNNSEEKPEAK